MVQDQEMHAHHDGHNDQYATVYPPDLHSYGTLHSSFAVPAGTACQRFYHSDAFGNPHRHEQHEAEHVYNSPQLALNPPTLNLRSNSNDNSPSANNNGGSNSTTPTGSLRLSAHNLPNLNSSGVATRRRTRAALEQLQIEIQVGVHAEAHTQALDQHSSQHQQSDMQDVHMHTGDMQMHVDERHGPGVNGHNGDGIEHEQGGTTPHPPHPTNMYALLPDANSPPGYYLSPNSDAFLHSPISPSTPSDASREPSIQAPSSRTGLTPPDASSTSVHAFRPGPLTLGISANRPMSLIPPTSAHGSPGQQQPSPSHGQLPQLSHPHMHPSPYYSLSHNTGSPGFPSTPTTSHHTQGSSSSSHSSGHTGYSLRGSPGPRGFGRSHARSSSFGTVSTMSVRSNSPANSVASAFTSLSGGAGGSAPASTSGPVGSPSSYGDTGDVQMSFTDMSPPEEGGTQPVGHHTRSQSHPPLSMPTAHPALAAYSALLPPPRKSLLQQGTGGYLTTTGERLLEEPRQTIMWPPHPDDYATPPPGPPMTEEELQAGCQAQFRSKPIITRAPHRKQKLANSDRKAICMYAKQHPNARQEDIAARYNVERSTISKILKNKERWLGCPDDEAKIARKRKPRFDDLELVLKIWVEDIKPSGTVLSDALIRSKAKEEARRLGILEDKFKASSGWLENFKHRVGIRKGKYIGREPWVAATDSEGEDPPLTAEQLHAKRIIFMANPPPGYEHAAKGFWRVPIPEIPRPQAVQNEQPAMSSLTSQPASESANLNQSQTSGSGQPVASEIEHGPSEPQQDSPSVSRPASQPEGCKSVGMRKTRSRTLAEAREAAALVGGPCSPPASSSSVAVLASSPSLGPTPTLPPTPDLYLSRGASHEALPKLSHPSSLAANLPLVPDGREASAGLDAALDFIGCQPQGFATPEEVAVLQKLSRRLSCAEPPRHQSSEPESNGWSGPGESNNRLACP